MKIIYSTIKLIYFSLLLYCITTIAVPYQFKRIIFTQGNEIIKTIDLIYDVHLDVSEIVNKKYNKKYQRESKKLLKDEEISLFTTGERSLLIALRTLAKQKEQIDLLWELTRVRGLYKLFEPTQTDFSQLQWIQYGGILAEEFSPQQKKSVVLRDADTYRFNNPKNLLDPDNSDAVNDLKAVEKHAFSHYHSILQAYWEQFKKDTVKPVVDYLLLHKNATIENVPNNIEEKWGDIPDAEFVIKPFTSNVKHTVIYAGGSHCTAVANILTDISKGFDGKEVFDLGCSSDIRDEKNKKFYIPIMIPTTWSYLLESPMKSLNRYKKYRNKAFTNLADDLWKPFIALRDQLFNVLLPKDNQDIKKSDENIHKELVDFYAQASKTFIDFINVRDGFGKTLLHYAVQKNLPETVEFLLQHNAYTNILDNEGRLPFDYASSEIIIEKLRRKGTREKGLTPKEIKQGHISAVSAVLLSAANTGNLKLVQKMIADGADINARDKDKQTALMLAAQGGHSKIVHLLLIKKADAHLLDNSGNAALDYAIEGGNKDILNSLISRGNVDINQENYQGFTPLLVAAQKGNDAVVELLIESDADVQKALNGAKSCCSMAVKRIKNALVAIIVRRETYEGRKYQPGTPLAEYSELQKLSPELQQEITTEAIKKLQE